MTEGGGTDRKNRQFAVFQQDSKRDSFYCARRQYRQSRELYRGSTLERFIWQTVRIITGISFAGPTRYVSKVDSDFFIEASGFLVPEFHGYVGPRMGLLLRDISEEVSMERMKRNLISVVAHELKTPVTTLRLQSETLQRQN